LVNDLCRDPQTTHSVSAVWGSSDSRTDILEATFERKSTRIYRMIKGRF
jgi:hypothetical protein